MLRPVGTYDNAVSIAESTPPQVALVNYRFEGGNAGVKLAQHLRPLGSRVIFVTGSNDEMRQIDPSAEILAKPLLPDDLLGAARA